MVFNPKRSEDVGSQGSGTTARIWHDAMEPILSGQPVVPFPPADPALAGTTNPAGPPHPATTAP